ncbi:MAG TPA: TOMM precursor leader peptide-binding protein [Candidatus Deferrimicrobiaceae bacterium]|nr:TOMM precursor leader peptide-binding protein [Candidatus Deferrimicrobiaceae bacterium]
MRYNIPMELTEGMILRYSRNILIQEIGPEGQERIFGSSVLVVGAGGLGSPALLYLAAAGVGRIGVADRDRIEISNLNRQVIHTEKSVGRRKVESAGDAIRAIRSDVVLEEHGTALTAENAVSLFRKYDVVIDGSDNFPTKYLCSDASVLTGVPLVHAGVLRFGGQLTTVIPGTGACLRCLIPEIPPRRDAPTCSESGILGAVAGIVGAWQAVEAIKVITGAGEPLAGRLLTLDALTGSVSVHAVSRDPQCPACGESPRIRLPLEPSEYDQERSCIV